MSILKRKIEEYLRDKPVPFHSPAHCGRAHPADLSELSGLDNLEYPAGIIRDSQDFIAGLFGASASFFLLGGASQGILAAILSLKALGSDKPLLLAPNVHKSVISALVLSGFNYEWLEADPSKRASGNGIFSAASLEKKIEEVNRSYSAIVLTNPSYEGFCTDFDFSSSQFEDLKIPLIVDEAHGAHYHFSEDLPKPALEYGADIVVQSWHKCLGSLTQTGVLHVSKDSKISKEILADNLRLLQSTSPSYLLMESLCSTAYRMSESGSRIFSELIECAKAINIPRVENQDPLRLLFNYDEQIGKQGLSDYTSLFAGELIVDLFEEEGFALESNTYNSALAFINIGNELEDLKRFEDAYYKIEPKFLERLASMQVSVDSFLDNGLFATNSSKSLLDLERFEPKLNPREAFYSKSKLVDLKESFGRVSAELYAPCPPGLPVLIPGQEITRNTIRVLERQNFFLSEAEKKIRVRVCA